MSMMKLIHSSVLPDELGAAATLVEDPARFVKRAAEARAIFDYEALKPDKDHVGIHVVALGDDAYPMNRNGDIFAKDACVKYHNTFVKFGKVFRHHMHDSADKAIGDIKASAYNDPMHRIELFIHAHKDKAAPELQKLASDGEAPFSMSARVPGDRCFIAGTPVLTPKGVVPIEKLNVGDLVVTHTGAVKPVTEFHRNKYSGRLATVKAANVPPISMTANHPSLFIPGEALRSCAGRRYTFDHPAGTVARYFNRDLGPILPRIAQAPAEQLRPGDYLFNPAISCTSDWGRLRGVFRLRVEDSGGGLSADAAYLCGSYAGDGSITKCRRGRKRRGAHYVTGIEWSCNETGSNLVKLLLALNAETDAKPGVSYSAKKHSCKLWISDRKLAAVVHACCGEYSDDKHIDLSYLSTQESRLSFLGGLIDTDGSCDADSGGNIRITVTSDRLAYDAWQLCLMSGLSAALRQEDKSSDTKGFKRNKPYIWVIHVAASAAHALLEYSTKLGGVYSPGKPCSTPLFYDSRWLTPIDSVAFEDVSDLDVYNITVADDETYVAGGLATHNCTRCNTFRKSAKDPNQCDHVKYALGRVEEDGKRNGVYNDDPKFFDISFVIKPADRIAWSLKTAGDNDITKIASTALAEMEGMRLDPAVMLDSSRALAKFELARKIAGYEDLYAKMAEAGPQTPFEREVWELRKCAATRAIPDILIEEMRGHDPHDMLYALAREKIIMDPVSYVKYAMGTDMGTLAPHIADIQKACAGSVSELARSGELYEACNESIYDVTDFLKFGDYGRGLAEKCAATAAEYGSLGLDMARHRTVLNTIDQVPVETLTRKTAEKNDSSLAKCVARKYVAYKLAAADAMQALDRSINEHHFALMAARNVVKAN
jgi:hypothetical protein